jgi:isoleucyl-tRNA synthetase
VAFQPVDSKVNFPRLEESVLEWWRANDIMAKSLAAGDRPFVFYEGPPTANGRPGVHHAISRSFKDIILRFRAQQGYRIVGRREGWDTHGLPVEIEVEKELGFKAKSDIERYGIAEFNAKCKESVWRYIQDWRAFSERIAFWLSPDAYITYENRYIESVWWIFKQLWERGLFFKDYKVTMHCPRCGTSLSDAEVSLGFQDDVDDPSVWIKFHLRHDQDAQVGADLGLPEGASFLAWTTTPWTLPANVALAVNPEAEYVLASKDGEPFILAAALKDQVLGEEATVLRSFLGRELVGLRYVGLYQGVPAPGDSVDWDAAYQVLADEFVSLEDGTGIVHIAPAYGDLEIGRKYGLPTLFSVDLAGKVLDAFESKGFGGLFFKQADPLISAELNERGLLFRSGRVRHAYPFCWRCSTPLLYYAKPSWYIRTTALKEQLVANNKVVNWVPEHVKEGRFGNWLENNIDWAISRERYWGTPLPIWAADDGSHMECIGSVAELSAKAGRDLGELDLHRPFVDEVTYPAPNGTATMRRIPDVADVWFDSGAMQIAQWHYPFENQAVFEMAHPADYICEAVDQTRGWFYTLHAIATLMFDRPAFKNVICLGHILDGEGQKMSKSKGNVVNPWDVINSQGVDALRWYMFASAPPGNPRRFSLDLVAESLRKFQLTLWNTYSFFVTYANLDGWTPASMADGANALYGKTPIDAWALARLNQLTRDVTDALERYDVYGAARELEGFVDELSNWYVRRNRRRFWKSESDADKQAAYATLYTCLVTLAKLLAPFTPFVSEVIYRNLVSSVDADAPESVHLSGWPGYNEADIDTTLLADTETLLRVIGLGRAARKHAEVRVRQPLSELWVRVPTPAAAEGLRRFEEELRDELNIKAVRYLDAGAGLVEYRFKPNLRVVGRKYGKQVPAITAALKELTDDAGRAAATVWEAGGFVTLQVDGQSLDLLADEVLIESSSPEGYAVAEDQGTLVALNTQIDEGLRLEGLARELVRNLQDARKRAGLEISDRIVAYVHGEGLDEVLMRWRDYIQGEVLADRLLSEQPHALAHAESVNLNGTSATIAVIASSTGP